jgi:3-hydroxybutyryl-CoA dehydrogenase
LKIAVIGAGIMGSGIAQISAMYGYEVALVDRGDAELESGRVAIEVSLGRLRKAGRLTDEESAATLGRLTLTPSLTRAAEGASVVVEAVPEILELKHEVLSAAVAAAPADAILASNTSQLSITRLGSALGDEASRFLGLHFFNPPVLMRLVELVVGDQTSDETTERGKAFAQSVNKEVVICQKDMAGFITTRAYAALRLEAIRILADGVASAADIDKALRLGFNFPMGPLELGDYNGLDTFYRAATSLEQQHGERFRPPERLRQLVADGHLGRKSGRGFYRYGEDGQRVD